MRILYASSNELLQYCRFGYLFSDYFVFIRGEKEESKISEIQIIDETDTELRTRAASRLSPYLSSANIIVKIVFQRDILEDEPYFILPITTIASLTVRDDNNRSHLAALLKDTMLETVQIRIEGDAFAEFIENDIAIASDKEPIYHPVIRILTGMTAALCNLLTSDFGKSQIENNPLLSPEFEEISFFPNEAHQFLRSNFNVNPQPMEYFDLFRHLKSDLEYLINDVKSSQSAWFQKGNDYNQYYNQTKKVFELYKAEVKADIAVTSYLGHILLTRLATGESGKATIIGYLTAMLDKIEAGESSVKQLKSSLKYMEDLTKGNLNRADFEKKIAKKLVIKSPLEKGLYLFFKHFDDDRLEGLNADIQKYRERDFSHLAMLVPYMYLGFIKGFQGVSPDIKKKLIKHQPYVFIWPLHILDNLSKDYAPRLFKMPDAISILKPFSLNFMEGFIEATATENSNIFFQLDATNKLNQLKVEERRLEKELEKINTQIKLLSSGKRTYPKPKKPANHKKTPELPSSSSCSTQETMIDKLYSET